MYQAGEPGLSIRHEYCEEIATTMIDRPSDRAAMIMEFSIHDESCPGDGARYRHCLLFSIKRILVWTMRYIVDESVWKTKGSEVVFMLQYVA